MEDQYLSARIIEHKVTNLAPANVELRQYH